MTLARYQAFAVDAAGNILPEASVTVRLELTGGLAPLYSDRAGSTPKGNPFTADADGYFYFHAIGGAYRVTVTLGSATRTFRYVGVGLGSESDFTILPLGETVPQVADIAARAVYDGEAAGFRVIVSDTGDGRAALYTMGPSGSGDWSDPAYITGPGVNGEPGSSDVVGTSTSSVAIGTGTKTFTIVEDDRGWGVGARLRMSSDANGANFMEGVVIAYSANTLEVSVDLVGGSGTLADWTINLAGEPGAGSVNSVNGQIGTVVVEADDINTTSAGTFDGDDVETVLDDHDGRIVDLEGEIAGKADITAIREKLTANRTYYVRTDGSDSNNGLADTSGGALLTPQKAFDVACTIDLNGFTVTISIGSGSFEGITFNKAWVGGNITIVGAGAANTTIASTNGLAAFYVSAPAPGVIRIDNMKITNSSGGAIRLDAAARFLCGSGLEFGTCVASHVLAAAPGSFLSMIANYTISGGSIYHLNAQFGAYIRATGITVTLTGTPAFSIAYANASNMGGMLASSCTFSGAATGPRYNALQGGGINTGGGGASYFPGSTAGTATSPGWYL